jgi:hypothetical protein
VSTTRILAAASVSALLLLAGCGGDDDSPTASGTTVAGAGTTTAAPTTTVPATTTTVSAAALKAALLQPTDIPGATGSAPTPDDADLSACFPGNPIGAKTVPSEVDSQDYEITVAGVSRNYSSSARVGTPEQAKSFATTFGTAAGSACALNAFKAQIAAPPNPADASGLTGKASTVPVGDAGSVMNVTGTIAAGGETTPLTIELYAIAKGSVVVFLTFGAIGGSLPPGEGLELAKKIVGRLP